MRQPIPRLKAEAFAPVAAISVASYQAESLRGQGYKSGPRWPGCSGPQHNQQPPYSLWLVCWRKRDSFPLSFLRRRLAPLVPCRCGMARRKAYRDRTFSIWAPVYGRPLLSQAILTTLKSTPTMSANANLSRAPECQQRDTICRGRTSDRFTLALGKQGALTRAANEGSCGGGRQASRCSPCRWLRTGICNRRTLRRPCLRNLPIVFAHSAGLLAALPDRVTGGICCARAYRGAPSIAPSPAASVGD